MAFIITFFKLLFLYLQQLFLEKCLISATDGIYFINTFLLGHYLF